ncbi:probable glutamate receptor [Panulirus ornatus]|uniref:probable glutamate receptor n=1 Tax=Panulirus ornatus TaxID=150431 RepID=UPI003A843A09
MVVCGVGVVVAAVLVCGVGGGEQDSPGWTGIDKFIMDYVLRWGAKSLHFLYLPEEDGERYVATVRAVVFRMARDRGLRAYVLSNLGQSAGQLYRHVPSGHSLLVASLRTDHHVHLLSQVLSEAQAVRYHWLLLVDRDSHHLLHQLFLPHNNQVQVASIGSNSSQVELWEQYQVAPGLRRHSALVGRWEAAPVGTYLLEPNASRGGQIKKGVWGTFLTYKHSRRPDMTGLHLRCLSEEWPPFTFVEYLPDGKVRVSGVLKELWNILQQRFNFTYECRRSPDGEWGGQRKDGSWTGMIGELVAGRADLVLGSVDQTTIRSQVVHYSHPLVTSTFRLLVRRVRSPVTGWSSFSMELSSGSWAALAATVAVSCLALVTILRCADEHARCPTTEAPMLVLGLLCHQGYPKVVWSTSERLLSWTVSILGVVTLAHYSSVMISSLALSHHTHPISSMRTILASNTFSFGLVRGTSTVAMFKETSVPVYQEVWREVAARSSDNLVPSIPAGVHKAATQNYIFLIDENIYNYRYAMDCNLMVVGPRYFRLPSTLIFRKGLPYTHIFDKELAKMAEVGLLDREYSRWRKRISSCNTSSVSPVDLESIFTALLLLLGGTLLALLLLLLEKSVPWLVRKINCRVPGRSHRRPPPPPPLFYKTSKIRRRKYH